MEYGLGRNCKKKQKVCNSQVLILVLMEYGLGQGVYKALCTNGYES